MKKLKKVESTLRFRNGEFRRKSFKFRHVESIVLATFFKGNKEDVEREPRAATDVHTPNSGSASTVESSTFLGDPVAFDTAAATLA